MSRQYFWETLHRQLSDEKKAILAVMTDATGSGPNIPGAKRVIFPSGKHLGTVGGGSAEFEITEKAAGMLENQSVPNDVITIFHHELGNENTSGMICGGEQTYALVRLDISDLATLDTLVNAERNRRPVRLILTEMGIGFQPAAEQTGRLRWETGDESWFYEETLFILPLVSIIGGGHVSLALSQVLSHLDFCIRVYDNRPNLLTMQHNTFAHSCQVIDYADIGTVIAEGPLSFAVIMTFGHQHDQDVLARLVNKKLKYLGMMGSVKKVQQIRESLLTLGYPMAALDRVHMPIGLPIGSQTPEEIAISIAAELIKTMYSEL